MRKVSEEDYKNFISWALSNTADRVYPCSIAEGFQSGDIYVNDCDELRAVFFWHYCGFGYISGKASEDFLQDIYDKMLFNQSGRRLVLITADDDVTAFFSGRDVSTDLRVEYNYLPMHGTISIVSRENQTEQIVTEDVSQNGNPQTRNASGDVIQNVYAPARNVSGDIIQNGFQLERNAPGDITQNINKPDWIESGKIYQKEKDYQIERITRENISNIEGRIIPSFSWETPERFLKNGFGYAAIDHGKVCAVAFSAAVSYDEVDIGVETHEDYRRRGLAAVLAGRMCEHIISIGKKPVWGHSISNKGSMNTALKCGFVQRNINTVISKK